MFKRTIVILMIAVLGLLMTACQKSRYGAGYMCRYHNVRTGQIFTAQDPDMNVARSRARMDCQSHSWPQSCRWMNCRYQGDSRYYDGRYSDGRYDGRRYDGRYPSTMNSNQY